MVVNRTAKVNKNQKKDKKEVAQDTFPSFCRLFGRPLFIEIEVFYVK